MTTAVQRRRGTSTEHATFTGLEGEITVNTTTYTLHVHDGATVGGVVIAKADGSNIVTSSIDINGGTIDGTVIGGSSAAAGTFTTGQFNTSLNVDGVITTDGMTTSATVNFPDGVGAYFGTGNDLQIYHSGTESIIADAGTGNLNLRGQNQIVLATASGSETYAAFNVNGASQLYYDNSEKLATTSTGIDVTGTVTADGLTVDGTAGATQLNILDDTAATVEASWTHADGSGTSVINVGRNSTWGGELIIQTDTKNRANFASNGDISFFEDTGTTAKFFWDASAESLGIGTSSPSDLLELSGTTAQPAIRLTDADVSGLYHRIFTPTNTGLAISADTGNVAADSFVRFDVDGSERMRINSSGNMGIGTSSPSTNLHVFKGESGGAAPNSQSSLVLENSSNTYIQFLTPATNESGILFGDADNDRAALTYNHSSDFMAFRTAAAERARIDSSGNLLVGKTAIGTATDGFEARASGYVAMSDTSAAALNVNRNTTDGALAYFYKDGTTVGSIGVYDGRPYLASTTVGIRVSNALFPSNTSGVITDGTMDIGGAAGRFNDIYATNGTIQTSDRNEKQDIEALSEAEQRVAVAAKGLLRKFRWKSKVEEKGDDARIHFGIIAQDLQAAFEAEGLDAGRYAMFISSTWTDEETGEERSRMGVRYSELLAFIIAAI